MLAKHLNSSNVFNPFMDWQRTIIEYQQTFDEGSESSKSSFANPNPYQRAEKLCVDCKKKISKVSIRCVSCAKVGQLNPSYNPKKMQYKCVCGKVIRKGTKRCLKCIGKYKSELFLEKINKKYSNFKIDLEVEQIMLGSLLGDGNLNKFRATTRFRENHSIKQKEYLEWKLRILSKNFELRIKEYANIKSLNGNEAKEYKEISLYTISYPILNYYHNLFYPNGKKIVTREILDKLKPLGLAVWYMDDGCYKYRTKNCEIATCGFIEKENLLIIEWFKEKGLTPYIYKNNGGNFVLRFRRNDAKRFIDSIRGYVPECMNYKLGLDTIKMDRADFLNKIGDKIKYRRKKDGNFG